jgi:superfamily II DNA or RNA helicase
VPFGNLLPFLQLYDAQGHPLLRAPQHGAAMAVGAHFTARKEPAIVALPTGVGKTAIMTLLPYVLTATRVLVVVPTRVLREQTGDEYSQLTVLRTQGLVPAEVWSPRTSVIEGHQTAAQWAALERQEVVVTTPQSVVDDQHRCLVPEGMFDLIIFDEAHHTPAPIWSSVVDHTSGARQIFFTATPYRRDDRHIQGTVVYEFPLSAAVEQGFVAPVDLRLIDDGADIDARLIEQIQQLVQVEGSPYFHVPFMARTSSKNHAKELCQLYEASGLSVRLITGDTSLRVYRASLQAVRDGEAQGLVMVGVLGEGFDFPAIKVAAYHRTHRSLPATLQFIGRITRIHADGPARALVVAPRQEASDETALLYRDDAQWALLIPELASRLFERQARRAMVDRELLTPVQGTVSPSNIRPKYVVDIFQVGRDLRIDVADRLDNDLMTVQWWQAEGFVVAIGRRDASPRWLYSDVLVETTFELSIAVYAREQGLLFVSTAEDTAAFTRLFGAADPQVLRPDQIYAVLNAQGVEAYYNVGIRNVDVPNDRRASYKISTGRDVTRTLLPDDLASYALGHAVARIRDEDGITRSFGISIGKSRVWRPQSGPLSEFRDWCLYLARLLGQAQPATMADGLPLRTQSVFNLFPATAIAAMPAERLFELEARVVWPDGLERSLLELDFEPHVLDEGGRCDVVVSADEDHRFDIICRTNGKIDIDGDIPEVRLDGNVAEAAAIFETQPLTLYFGDGSSTRSFLRAKPAEQTPALSRELIEILKFTNVDISKETETDIPGRVSIFDYMHDLLEGRSADAVIINDDGAYEMADIIVLTNRGVHVEVGLLHCKGAVAKTEQVEQLYVVVGQAIRSMRWVARRAMFWADMLRRFRDRDSFNVIRDPNGDIEQLLERWAQAAPATTFWIGIVQPGLLYGALRQGTSANILLSSCHNSASSAGAEFKVFCSERD